MRRIALGATVALLIAIVAVAVAARGSTRAAGSTGNLGPTGSLGLTADHEKSVVDRERTQDLFGYWGGIKANVSGETGNYRASCVELKGTSDNRINCNIIFSFASGSNLVLQGMVTRPTDAKPYLFATKSAAPVAVTGGGGLHSGKRGYADLNGDATGVPHIDITFTG
jgi:hypothetical protein